MFDKSMFMNCKIADKNSEIMTMYFQLNKKLDNFVNWLEVVANMNKLSNALHINYAHKAPIDADRFSDYNALYSYRSKYGTVNAETIDFECIAEGIEDVLSFIVDMDNMLSSAHQLALDENNEDYRVFIDKEINELRVYKKQFILLNDKVGASLMSGNTYQDIDNRYEDFMIEV